MSGVEIVGVVLGVFPLLISGLERYESTRRFSVDWWQIKRAHDKDLRNLKDCNLAFRTHLKELLLPLLVEGVADERSYEDLLANPGGSGWREESVNEALVARLMEHHERYFKVMEETTDAMAKLSTKCKVDDHSFQLALEARQSGTRLSRQACMKFESKRVGYAFMAFRRDALLREVDRYIAKLGDLLAANDRVNAITRRRVGRPSSSTVPKALLEFWRHAESIFRVVKKAWQCQCTSQTTLWLRHDETPKMDMTMLMRFCHGPSCIHVQLLQNPSQSSEGPGNTARSLVPPDPNTAHQGASAPVQRTQMSHTGQGSVPTITVSDTPPSVSTTTIPGVQDLSAPQQVLHRLINEGLCRATTNSCTDYGTLVDDDSDREYRVTRESSTLLISDTTSLSSLLATGSGSVPRAKRYSIALTIVSSHAQLHSTSWMKAKWTLDDIRVPIKGASVSAHEIYDHPCLQSALSNQATVASNNRPDQSFRTLGIVLLELCFGTPFEHHSLWNDPNLPRNLADPIQRQAVAFEWAEEVGSEAGVDYAAAVHWCLQKAPRIIIDDKWRAEFVQGVVQPLQRCQITQSP